MPARLFAGLFARGAVAAETSEDALVRAMVEVELALLRALTAAGLAPAQAAADLPDPAALGGALDLDALGRGTGTDGTPVPALISALRERLAPEAAAHLHRGATSQDILDTALMLVARRALGPLSNDLRASADTCAELAARHRGDAEPGRTLLQQGVPVTFGLKAAGWMSGLDAAREELERLAEHELAVQLGGAVGTLAAFGSDGVAVMTALAAELGLAVPALPWHTIRVRPARLASGLAVALGVLGKIGRDVVLLAQTEVAEAAESAAGGSSTMPHKRNPVGSIAAVACAHRAPGLLATIAAAMLQEHERGAGPWQAEWEPMLELLRLAGSAAAAVRDTLAGLEVDVERMRLNLEITGGLVMSESVVAALTPALTRPRAQALVTDAARVAAAGGRPLREILAANPEVAGAIGDAELDAALDPGSYLGATQRLIDRALEAHRG
jgi:3-carboxy-cis,cis-muconate cycloisomerase